MRKYGGRIKLASKKHDRNWHEVLAVTVAESCGERFARSRANAKSLMQLMDPTARKMGIKDPYHPYDNLWAGAKYLKFLEKEKGFKKMEERFLAYNAGPKGARKWLSRGKMPMEYNYVRSVVHVLTIVRKIYKDPT